MAIPERFSGQDAQAVVVLVKGAHGRELEVVRDALVHSLNTPTVLITHADLESTPVSVDLSTGLLDVDGRRVRPAVVWIRHSSAAAMVAQARPPGSMTPLGAASWSGFLGQVAGLTTGALPGYATAGPGQLVDARRLGLNAPRTVVTTDVATGVREMNTPQVIIKTPDFRLFEPESRAWPAHLPKVVDRDAVHGARSRGGPPVLVQEYVPHAQELRVYYLNGGVCAFAVHQPGPASIWTDPASVTVSHTDCPEAAEKAVRTLCAAWHLRYGAFDLLVSRTGEPVFLEANPDGDWLWYERKAGWHGVSFMAAVMVRDLFIRCTSLGARADDCDSS
jgi:hypothetical protein